MDKKGVPFHWSVACEEAFKKLKVMFTSVLILQHFDPELETIVETDVSDHVDVGVFSQQGTDGIVRLVAYYSRKHSAQECNYEIYDKELLAVVRAFKEWRPELEGTAFPITVITDHRNLEYFMSMKLLS